MQVLVAGASGDVGREVLAVLRRTDHRSVALTGDAGDRTGLLGDGADEVRVGDPTRRRDADEAVAGCDAVVSTIGWEPDPRLLVAGGFVGDRGVPSLAAAAADAGVGRFVLRSSLGVGDSKRGLSLPYRLLWRASLAAVERDERAVRESGAPYTILRAGRLTGGPATREVLVADPGGLAGSIPRADLARALVAAASTDDAENRTLEVVSRRGLRGEARGLADVRLDWPD